MGRGGEGSKKWRERLFSLTLPSIPLPGRTEPRKQLLRSYLVLPLEASLDGFLFNGSHFRFRLRCRFCLGGDDGHLLLGLCGFVLPQLRRPPPPSLLFLLCGSELRDQVVQFAELEKLRKGTRESWRSKEGTAAKFMTVFFGGRTRRDPHPARGSYIIKWRRDKRRAQPLPRTGCLFSWHHAYGL